MAKTRATKPAAGKKKNEATSTKRTLKTLDESEETPPQVFVLPEGASADARIASMPNPATDAPNRYLVCPEKGFYEFTRVAAPKRSQRSWLLALGSTTEEIEAVTAEKEVSGPDGSEKKANGGYVLQTPDMFVATPVDPLFIFLPSLAGEGTTNEYLAPSDYLSKLTESSRHLSQMISPNASGKLERTMESRMEAVCDCMDMGDDKMYALSLPKLVKELVSKAKRMTAKGLPTSMEDKFVKQALDVPVLSIKREESSISIASEEATPGAESQPSTEVESQESNASGTTMASVSISATSISISNDTKSNPEGVSDLLRLRVALNFLLTSYISPKLRSKLGPLLSDAKVSGTDFTILEKHLAHVASLKKEAMALRSLSDNISRKRPVVDDDEAILKAETKKRKKEEEERSKKSVSQGVKKLAKADTSGMKKLSSFFGKAAGKS